MDDRDAQQRREAMTQRQLVARGISDAAVLEAMRSVPRHRFVDADCSDKAYDDTPLTIGCSQTISQPYMVALMTELLALSPEDRVLEIGTGSGYQTAVLAQLACVVVSVERHAALVQSARKVLYDLQMLNAYITLADGTLGYPEQAPYDAILVTAGSPKIPTPLLEQLKVGGRLVCPVGSRKAQVVVRATRTPKGFENEKGVECKFVPLIGENGWHE